MATRREGSSRPRLSLSVAVAALVAFAGTACASARAEPPAPGYERGSPFGLNGNRVMVLPVQIGGFGDLDREIGYALSGRGPDVEWVSSDELRQSAARNPGIEVDGLSVQAFLAGDIVRIGDPLFGQLYRLGGLADASYAVIPIEAVAGAGVGPAQTIELSAALVDVRTGLVPWFVVVAGEPGAPGDVYVAATAAEAMARRLLP